MKKVQFIVPRSSYEEHTFAVITAELDRRAVERGLEAGSAFREVLKQVVTQMILDMPDEYRSTWEYAGSDLNIGDLASSFDEGELSKRLCMEGVYRFELAVYTDGEMESDWTYDTPLVDAGRVEEEGDF